MRHALGAQEGKRLRYTATYVREGTKRAFKGPPLPTVLFAHVRDASGREVADHLWFNRTKAFAELCLNAGDIIAFDGRVESYEKGYKGHRDDVFDAPIEEDYKVSRPTKVEKIASGIPRMQTHVPRIESTPTGHRGREERALYASGYDPKTVGLVSDPEFSGKRWEKA